MSDLEHQSMNLNKAKILLTNQLEEVIATIREIKDQSALCSPRDSPTRSLASVRTSRTCLATCRETSITSRNKSKTKSQPR